MSEQNAANANTNVSNQPTSDGSRQLYENQQTNTSEVVAYASPEQLRQLESDQQRKQEIDEIIYKESIKASDEAYIKKEKELRAKSTSSSPEEEKKIKDAATKAADEAYKKKTSELQKKYKKYYPEQKSSGVSGAAKGQASKSNKVDPIRTRLNEQAALMLNIDKIINAKAVKPTKKQEKKRTEIEYKNFYVTRLKESGHTTITSLLTKHNSMNAFFNKLPSQVLSLLVPSIKLYKVFYPKLINAKNESSPDKNDKTKEKPISWRIPFDDIPIQYRKQTSNVPPQSVDEILNGNGFLHTVGIKSFSYSYQGNNPATANTLVSAELKLFFQSPEELMKEFNIVHEGINGKYTFAYTDLINSATRTERQEGKLDDTPNENYYRIKIICGYSDSNNDLIRNILLNENYNNDKITEVLAALSLSRATFYLSPYSYDISFNESGAVDLSIKCNASVDKMLLSEEADIFYTTEELKQARHYIKALNTFVKNKDRKPTEIKTNGEACVADANEKSILKEFFQKYPEAKKDEKYLKQRLYNFRKNSYNSIFKKLIGAGKEKQTHDNVGIYSAYVNNKILSILSDENNIDSRENDLRNQNSFKGVYAENINDPLTIKRNLLKGEHKDEDAKGKANSQSMDEQAMKELDKQTNSQASKSRYNGFSQIKFMFLGDLIDAALDCLDNLDNDHDRPRIVLGEITMEIPTINNIGEEESKHLLTVNLADVPISMKLFEQFFIKKVVKQMRDKYPAMEFIKDAISELIFPALNPSVFGKSYTFNSKIKYSILSLNVGMSNGRTDPVTGLDVNSKDFGNGEHIIDDKKIEQLQKQVTDNLASIKESLDNLNYIFIYCSSGMPRIANPSEEDDIKRGIYHVRMGRDSGLIKKIDFTKSEIPFQREFMARREGNKRGTSIKQLYNANISMFGNNIYVPGDYIYIEPYFLLTTNKTLDLQDSLGLGGYYMVLKVNSSIAEASFDTKLECIFQGQLYKDGDKKKLATPNTDKCLKGEYRVG